ncbi:MAG: alpha/beta hydrolase [Anaerolineae bacterium]
MSRWGYSALALLVVAALAVLGFVVWAETPLGPMPEALSALSSDGDVIVQADRWLTFLPAAGQPETGLILYPGGRVDPRSYAPLARRIAAEGYLVVITPMPLNLAFLAPDRAADVMAAYPEIQTWAIGGHSLGGAMAARFAARHPERVHGVVLWASYPPDSDPLTDFAGPVLSVYGTEDMGRDGIEARRDLLPPHARWGVIPGGNHAQMGWYGPQRGDGVARIDREEQQAIVLEATVEFLQQVEARRRR